jgi:hypothetical protein
MASKQPPKIDVDRQSSLNHFNVIGVKKHPGKGEPDLKIPKSLRRIDLALFPSRVIYFDLQDIESAAITEKKL